MAASYTIMLRKHFRSYPELIGYSSSTFYDHQLQAIKVRGRPISEVIRFDQIDAQGKAATRATNQAEADFIEEQLIELLGRPSPPTVGIITPFREQHTLLTKKLFGHARAPEFEKTLRLKVMTFDSCQGEEREIIFYSMVATRGQDALNYIFPVALTNAQENVEEKLKMQRLNVGFSRAQETVWIVHSMPIDEFRGSIGGALNHYRTTLKKKEVLASTTDQSSPMEAKILGWLQATSFVSSQPDTVEIVPQFPIGDYLKQLDPLYEHPAYRVDFLLTCETAKGVVSIVVEYDGFEYHFDGGSAVNVGNHARYLKDGDVERQLTLESYGYRFLRVNRFNLDKDPVATLDERLIKLMQVATGETTTAIVERLREQAAGLVSKELKACSRCGEIRTPQDYFDKELREGAGGFGRICMSCKGIARRSPTLPGVDVVPV